MRKQHALSHRKCPDAHEPAKAKLGIINHLNNFNENRDSLPPHLIGPIFFDLSSHPDNTGFFCPVVMPRTLASPDVVAPFQFGGLSGLIEGL